jgi:hypothetical protein
MMMLDTDAASAGSPASPSSGAGRTSVLMNAAEGLKSRLRSETTEAARSP